jgi:hypothetical protein
MKRKKKRGKQNSVPLLAPLPGRTYPIGSGRVLVYPEGGTAPRIISSRLTAIYRRLTGFKTVTEHIRELQSGSPDTGFAEHPGALLESGIEELSRQGLLVSKEELLEKTASAEHNGEGGPEDTGIKIIAWPTEGRPLALVRSVAGAVRNARRFGRSPVFQVYDDAPAPDKRLSKSLGTLAAREEMPICYCGQEEKAAYIRALSEHAGLTGEQEQLLSFALFGESSIETRMENTNGGNRNAILLGTAGSTALCSDDDVVFSGRDLSGEGGWEPLRIRPGEGMLNVRHFDSTEEVFGAFGGGEIDVLAAFESYLNRRLSSLIREHGSGSIDLSHLKGPMLSALMNEPDEAVRIALPSIIGDSGRPNNHMLLGEKAPGRAAEEGELGTALSSRYVHRFTDAPTVSSRSHFMSTVFAMDNREMPPPFFPLGRGNDGAFGAAFRYVYQSGLIAYLPMALLHAPLPPRGAYSEGIEDVHTRVSDVLTRLTERFMRTSEMMPASPEERFTQLGEHFRALARLPVARLRELLRHVSAERLSHYLAALEEKLETMEAPSGQLVEIYRIHMEAVQRYMASEDFAEPSNITAPDEQKFEVLQHLLGQYGRLLMHWPVLHAAARSASAGGIRPGRFL